MAATGKTQYFKDSFEELAGIKTGAVIEFAYKWLTRERAVSLYFEPESDQMPRMVGGGGGGARRRRRRRGAGHTMGGDTPRNGPRT